MAADERVLRFVEEALRREVPRAEIGRASCRERVCHNV